MRLHHVQTPLQRFPALACALAVGLGMGVNGAAQPGGRSTAAEVWSQWGGPGRDFHAAHLGRELKIGPAGPKILWKRELGEGYSGIVTDGRNLFTVFGRGDQNVIVALDGASGKTLWEQALDAAPLPNMFLDYGRGPNATPLIVGNRLFVVSFIGRLVSLDTATGKIAWQKELWRDVKGTFRDVGYSNSPIAYKDTVIVPVGGAGKGVAAFRQSDGGLVWQGTDLENAMSSPILIDVNGEKQLVMFMVDEVAGVSPDDGRLLWRHAHQTQYSVNSSTPLWCRDNTLLVSSAYNGGTRAIQLTRAAGKTTAKELWFNRRLRVHHGNMLRLGDYVYASSGDFGPAPLTAVHIPTGKVAWQDRHFPKASLVQVGKRTLLLDEGGRLALANLTPEKLEVLSEAEVLTKTAWTAPTVVGDRVYVRDRKSMVALQLERE